MPKGERKVTGDETAAVNFGQLVLPDTQQGAAPAPAAFGEFGLPISGTLWLGLATAPVQQLVPGMHGGLGQPQGQSFQGPASHWKLPVFSISPRQHL